MTTAVTLTPRSPDAEVVVDITGAPAGAVTITRTDDNGQHTVRLQDGQQPISGSLTIHDYEAALNGTVQYDVLDSAAVVTSASTTTGVTEPRLSAVVLPQYRNTLVAVTSYDSDQDTNSTVHWVIDRNDPIVRMGQARTREGTMEMFAEDYVSAKDIAGTLGIGEVCLIRQPDFIGLDMYFVPRRISIRPRGTDTATIRWLVSVDYTEVIDPDDPLLGAASWNYDAVKADYATYDAVKAAFASYSALTKGP